MIPVVIGSHPDSPWLVDCIKSLRQQHRQIKIHNAGGYELNALRTGLRYFDRFLFLQDSCEVLHPTFWDVIDGLEGGAWLFGGPPMYLGVYNRDELQTALEDAPDIVDKRTSIRWEGELPQRLNYPVIWPDVTDATGRFKERHGRNNLVLENRYLRKWKGNWGQG